MGSKPSLTLLNDLLTELKPDTNSMLQTMICIAERTGKVDKYTQASTEP